MAQVIYRWVVRRRVLGSYRRLSAGNAGPLVRGLHPAAQYRFLGEGNPLAGLRRGRQEIGEFLADLLTRFPGTRFDPVAVAVGGWPWRTTVLARVQLRQDRYAYDNVLYQTLVLRWGKVVAIESLEDGAKTAAAVARQRAAAPGPPR